MKYGARHGLRRSGGDCHKLRSQDQSGFEKVETSTQGIRAPLRKYRLHKLCFLCISYSGDGHASIGSNPRAERAKGKTGN